MSTVAGTGAAADATRADRAPRDRVPRDSSRAAPPSKDTHPVPKAASTAEMTVALLVAIAAVAAGTETGTGAGPDRKVSKAAVRFDRS